jgi:hypothetical protein
MQRMNNGFQSQPRTEGTDDTKESCATFFTMRLARVMQAPKWDTLRRADDA